VDVRNAHLNEELIVRYLLGELPEAQQIEIEDSAFQNQQHLQDILAVESDLIDEYVRGEIPLRDREQFERHFLLSPESRRKVDFARALATVISESQTRDLNSL
jgi:anti-sigma factor RsiW